MSVIEETPSKTLSGTDNGPRLILDSKKKKTSLKAMGLSLSSMSTTKSLSSVGVPSNRTKSRKGDAGGGRPVMSASQKSAYFSTASVPVLKKSRTTKVQATIDLENENVDGCSSDEEQESSQLPPPVMHSDPASIIEESEYSQQDESQQSQFASSPQISKSKRIRNVSKKNKKNVHVDDSEDNDSADMSDSDW